MASTHRKPDVSNQYRNDHGSEVESSALNLKRWMPPFGLTDVSIILRLTLFTQPREETNTLE